MKYITHEDLLKYKSFTGLAEKFAEYKVSEYPKDEIYNKNNIEKIDKKHDKMIETIIQYAEEIMRKGFKNNQYPIVVPIVIYTGFQKWNVETNFSEKQYQSPNFNFKNYNINIEYNLISIQDYSFEELLDKKTLFGSIMIIEKCKTAKKLNEQLTKIVQVIKDSNDKKTLAEIIRNVVVQKIGIEKAKKLLEKIKESEEIGMSPLTKMLLDLEYNAKVKGREEGREEVRKESQKSILSIVRKMLERNMEIREIEEITGLPKEEIEKLAIAQNKNV